MLDIACETSASQMIHMTELRHEISNNLTF